MELQVEINTIYISQQYKVFIFILCYAFIIFSPYLGEHFVHDTYLVLLHGNMRFVNQLLSQGRIFSAGIHYLCATFNLPVLIVMTVSTSLSLIFLSVASFVIYNMVKRDESIIIPLFSSLCIFFNLFITDSLLFVENAIMSLGILFAVLACRLFLNDKTMSYIVSTVFLTITVFCYQPNAAYFMPLVILFIKSKNWWRRLVVASIVYGLANLINFIFVKYFNLLLYTNDIRITGEVKIITNIIKCIYHLIHAIIYTFEFLPFGIFFIVCIVFALLISIKGIYTKNLNAVIRIYTAGFILLICVIFPFIPTATERIGFLPRSIIALATLPGILTLGYGLYFPDKGKVKSILSVLLIVFIVSLSQKQIDIQKNNYANIKLDDYELSIIAKKVFEYENLKDIKIEEIFIVFNNPLTKNHAGIKDYADNSIRILSISWMVNPMINHYLDRNYPEQYINIDDYNHLFFDKNWDSFDFNQLIFEENILYIYIK